MEPTCWKNTSITPMKSLLLMLSFDPNSSNIWLPWKSYHKLLQDFWLNYETNIVIQARREAGTQDAFAYLWQVKKRTQQLSNSIRTAYVVQ